MKLGSVILLSFLISLSSCGVLYLGERVKSVEIGMSKKAVVEILGKSYVVKSSFLDEQGNTISILLYQDDVYKADYILDFFNDKLVSIHREDKVETIIIEENNGHGRPGGHRPRQ